MTTIHSARWLVPVSSTPIEEGAIAIAGETIAAVGPRNEVIGKFPNGKHRDHGNAMILPGLINVHTHLELTVMRGYLEREESDFFSWLKKLTLARLFNLTPDDLEVSATWGACEALRAGITSVGDASDSAITSLRAVRSVGLRGVVFQESFGPDARLVSENVDKLKNKVAELRSEQTELVRVGVSPHAPYSVCASQLEEIADFAAAEKLPLMMHAAESEAEDLLLREGCGLFADGLKTRAIEFKAPGCSPIQHLKQHRILDLQPLLAHCIRVDDRDLETLAETGSKVAHCPKSNAKLRHGRAPFAEFLRRGITVGLGSDSVASNNTCDVLEEGRFAVLLSRAGADVDGGAAEASDALYAATMGGTRCLGLNGRVGQLAQGFDADFTVVSLNGTHQLPVYDPVTAAIFSSSGRDVVLTVVAGREVYVNGHVVGVDEERLRARIQEISQKLR
ncbi:MAG TPA: amidohydrolase family protein [Pyrinomonadaceae bacterium]|nr:amidohydrolase family protein [Pyrinomonadaceae bacterium]